MLDKPDKRKINFYLILIFLFVWIILTELLFNDNQIFPSPSLVILSLQDLFSSYDFLLNLISSVSAIYISIFITILIIKIKYPFINNNSRIINYLMQIPKFFFIVPEILIGTLLIYWFRDSYFIKLFYAVFIISIFIYQTILKYDLSKIADKIDAVKSLSVTKGIVRKKIIWKFMEPEIFKNLIDNHVYLWSIVIAFEFIQNSDGIGFVLRSALEFNDLAIIISLIILIAIIVYAAEKLLKFINDKYYFWN